MFERYTERARRALFFARYEASEVGGNEIGTEHLLLGLLGQAKGCTSDFFERAGLRHDALRADLQQRMSGRPRHPTSMEIPFSAETKGILYAAAAEADQLGPSWGQTAKISDSLSWGQSPS